MSSASLVKRVVSERLLGSTSVTGVPGSLTVGSLSVVEDVRGGVVATDGGRVRSGVRADSVGSGTSSCGFGGNLVVQGVEALGLGAVEVEPPVADEVVLVQESSVGAEEAVLGEPTSTIGRADVESLALSLRVRVVT